VRPPLRWTAAALYAAGIFILSSIPDLAPKGPRVVGIDKLAHAVLYFFFAAVLWWALRGSGAAYAALFAVLVAAVFGATDEFHQHFVPGRVMSLLDWLADLAGAALWPAVLRLKRRRAIPPRQRPAP